MSPRVGAALAVCMVALAGCAGIPLGTPTPPTVTEDPAFFGGFGDLYLVGAGGPLVDAVVTGYVALADGSSLTGERAEAGSRLEVFHRFPAGTYRLVVNGSPCAGTFPVLGRLETDVVLTLAPGGCSIAVVQQHAPGTSHQSASPDS